jgi:hypothetical protein
MGCFWSLQSKKVPKWHFFKILGAKRNKLLVFNANGNRAGKIALTGRRKGGVRDGEED